MAEGSLPQETEIALRLVEALGQGKISRLVTYTGLHREQEILDRLVARFLQAAGLGEIADQIVYGLKELIVNAKKANTKRIFFQEQGLDPHDPEAYDRGMVLFKSEMIQRNHHFMDALRSRGLHVKVELGRIRGFITVAVRNNTPLLEKEAQRIGEKIEAAGRYENLGEALADLVDETEGAGLGLLVLVQMLKKIGLRGDFFRIYVHKGETIARILIPV